MRSCQCGCWPRVLRRDLAARYLGLGLSKFDEEVAEERLPQPIPIAGSVKGWLRDDLDAWIDDRRGAQNSPGNSWDEP